MVNKRICPVCGELDEFIKDIDGKYTCLTCGYEESMADADRKFKFELTLSKTGNGAENATLYVDGEPTNEGTYDVEKYSEVELEVDAEENKALFKRWEIENIGTGYIGKIFDVVDNPLTLPIICKKKVTAVVAKMYKLTTQTSNTSQGTTNPAPGNYYYEENTQVQVTAIPEEDYELDHWELDTENVGSDNPYTVTMDNNHTLKAVFKAA